ncbi:MAG: sensor histidine kinase [Gemmataceae bacterium]
MSLTTRLTAFALAALAVVLAGFSATLYGLAYAHLHRQDDERLAAALDTLAAACEVNSEGVEWEPTERRLHIGADAAAVRWVITTEKGAVLGRSPGLTDTDEQDLRTATSAGWRYDWRHLEPDLPFDPSTVTPPRHTFIDITAAVSTAPTRAVLRWLAAALTGVSGAIWLLALPASRWVCRRALRPVQAMAKQADTMQAADRDARLAVAPTGDELEALGRAFNGLLDRMHEAHERQRRFTGDASHQLRTPLAGLLGQVEVSLRQARTADEYRRVLERVHRQGQHLSQIVEMLLFLARADADALPAALETVDLSMWLHQYLLRWADHPRAADLRLKAGSGPSGVKVQPPLLGQLLDNLLDNAVKYSPPNTPIIVRLTASPSAVSVAVEDCGDGISPDDLPHVFTPFYRSDSARRHGRPGVGLGLSVAQRIARLFGGTLTVSSTASDGSRFELTLPRVVVNEPAELSPAK